MVVVLAGALDRDVRVLDVRAALAPSDDRDTDAFLVSVLLVDFVAVVLAAFFGVIAFCFCVPELNLLAVLLAPVDVDDFLAARVAVALGFEIEDATAVDVGLERRVVAWTFAPLPVFLPRVTVADIALPGIVTLPEIKMGSNLTEFKSFFHENLIVHARENRMNFAGITISSKF